MSTAEIIAMCLVKYGPSAARALVALFQKAEPTVQDWEAVFSLCEKSYDDYVKPV